ncbi:MAG: beta-ketoacyl-[acyl-carrier-protein] synthase II, partial [Planctomycetes bacterium]|nr:beta-ketoacyl-[acyl-carrier-protein] synthase II [Planctomycetota bacterium]
LEFAFAALTIEEGWIPPALGVAPLDPEIAITVPTELVRGQIRRVLSNSFAFGGNNVSLLVGAP